MVMDKVTAARLKRLARKWKVSQAEVVRRSIMEAKLPATKPKVDPIKMLHCMHEEGGGLSKKAAEKWLAEIRQDRRHWRANQPA